MKRKRQKNPDRIGVGKFGLGIKGGLGDIKCTDTDIFSVLLY